MKTRIPADQAVGKTIAGLVYDFNHVFISFTDDTYMVLAAETDECETGCATGSDLYEPSKYAEIDPLNEHYRDAAHDAGVITKEERDAARVRDENHKKAEEEARARVTLERLRSSHPELFS